MGIEFWMKYVLVLATMTSLLNYHCLADVLYFCEGSSMHIRCQNNATITIKSATYGRLSRNICRKPPMKSIRCRSPKSLKIVKKACHGKSQCTLAVNGKTFGDPCYMTSKYLMLTYKCQAAGIPPAPKKVHLLSKTSLHVNFKFSVAEEWLNPVSTYQAIVTDKVTGDTFNVTSSILYVTFNMLTLNREFQIKVRSKSITGYGEFSEPLTFTTVASAVSDLCEFPWERYGKYCYFYNPNTTNWANARSSCQERNSDLMSIWGSGEQRFLRREMKFSGYAFIGLNDIASEGHLVWSDGSKYRLASFKSFYKNENNTNNQDCVIIHVIGKLLKWFYSSCDVSYSSFCKKYTSKTHLEKPNIIREENNTGKVSCNPSSGHFVSRYTWLLNGTQISNVTNIILEQPGVYYCIVKYNHNLSVSSDPYFFGMPKTVMLPARSSGRSGTILKKKRALSDSAVIAIGVISGLVGILIIIFALIIVRKKIGTKSKEDNASSRVPECKIAYGKQIDDIIGRENPLANEL